MRDNSDKPILPSEFMRELRPEYYSDAYVLKALLAYVAPALGWR